MDPIYLDPSKTMVHSLTDIRRAAEALRDLAQEVGGYRVAACANIASKEPMTDSDGGILAVEVFGWRDRPDNWWRKPLLALNSPLPIACRYESEAFWCNSSTIHTRQPNKFLQELDLSKYDETVPTRAVICVPVHLPFGQVGAVSFSHPDKNRTDLSEDFEKYGVILEDATRRFIAGYVKAVSRHSWIPNNCRLTKREVECLTWAAVGKTDREIAAIISRSCATVRFHIHNAGEKLDAVNRSQTVFKAAQLGYLGSVAVELIQKPARKQEKQDRRAVA